MFHFQGKKWHEQVESVKNEAQSRCSSLVRLSEQHKQEALKAQALLHRLEVQSNATISKQTGEMSEAALNIQQTRNRLLTLIEKLMKTYKVSQELLQSAVRISTQINNYAVESGNFVVNLFMLIFNLLLLYRETVATRRTQMRQS